MFLKRIFNIFHNNEVSNDILWSKEEYIAYLQYIKTMKHPVISFNNYIIGLSINKKEDSTEYSVLKDSNNEIFYYPESKIPIAYIHIDKCNHVYSRVFLANSKTELASMRTCSVCGIWKLL